MDGGCGSGVHNSSTRYVNENDVQGAALNGRNPSD